MGLPLKHDHWVVLQLIENLVIADHEPTADVSFFKLVFLPENMDVAVFVDAQRAEVAGLGGTAARVQVSPRSYSNEYFR